MGQRRSGPGRPGRRPRPSRATPPARRRRRRRTPPGAAPALGRGCGRSGPRNSSAWGMPWSANQRTRSGYGSTRTSYTFRVGNTCLSPWAAPTRTSRPSSSDSPPSAGERPRQRAHATAPLAGRRRWARVVPLCGGLTRRDHVGRRRSATVMIVAPASAAPPPARATTACVSRRRQPRDQRQEEQRHPRPRDAACQLQPRGHDQGERGHAGRLGEDRALPHRHRRRQREGDHGGGGHERGHVPPTTVATDAASAAQHSTAVAACRSM